MKNYIIFILIFVILLTGCSSGKIVEAEVNLGEEKEANDNTYNDNDIRIMKVYVILMSQYDMKISLMDDFKTDAIDLLTIMKYELPPVDYEEILNKVDNIAKNHELHINNIEDHEETEVKLLELAELYSLEKLKYLEDFKEINKNIRDIEKEYSNSYEQIELYMKNNNSEHIERYLVYQTRFRDLWEETKILLMENKNEIYNIILNY